MGVRIIHGDCRDVLPTLAADSVDCVVTSPPYWGLRDYGVAGQIGLEPTLAGYLETMVGVFRELRRVLKPSGTCWLNIGSSYWGGGRGGNPAESEHRKQATNVGSLVKAPNWRAAAGGNGPNQSRRPSRAQAYDSDGKGPLGSPSLDSAYSGLDGEDRDGSRSRRDRSFGNDRSKIQTSSLDAPTDRGNAHLDSERARDETLPPPTVFSSLPNALGASCLEATVSAAPLSPIAAGDDPECVRKAGYNCGTGESGWASRTSGTGVSERACDCGSCGFCFVYLTTTCLKLKPKDLVLVPDLLALALQADGWWVRSEIIWAKPNPMPESVTDRPTCAHEKVWLLTKGERYLYDADSIREPGVGREDDEHGLNGALRHPRKVGSDKQRGHSRRHAGFNDRWDQMERSHQVENGANARNVWTIASEPYRGAHYAVMPSALAERCIKAGCPQGGSVLDPFGGAGTTGLVADRLGRNATLIELNPANREMAAERVTMDGPLFADVS